MAQRQLKITKAQEILGYVFPEEDQGLLWDALQGPGDSHTDNRTMAMGGDVVLKLVLIEDMEDLRRNRGIIYPLHASYPHSNIIQERFRAFFPG